MSKIKRCSDCVYWEKCMNWCIKRTDPTINHEIAASSCKYWEEKEGKRCMD